MKKLLPVLLLATWLSLPSFQYLKAQEKVEEEELFIDIEESAEPKGGFQNFYKHCQKHHLSQHCKALMCVRESFCATCREERRLVIRYQSNQRDSS